MKHFLAMLMLALPAPEDSYPAQLERRLNADGYHVSIINDGANDDTTADGLARIDRVLAQKPDIVLMDLGGNDLLHNIPPAQVYKNLYAILSRFQLAHITVIMLAQRAPLLMGAAYAGGYNGIFPKLAAAYSAGLYPDFLKDVYGKPDLMQPDGIHPTPQGVTIMVNNTYRLITSSLRK